MGQSLRIYYEKFVGRLERLQGLFLLTLRLYWGWQFFQAGKGKLGDPAKVAGFFETLGIPFPHFNAILVGTVECFGGLLLLVGLGSRLVSIPLIITMIVAYLTAHVDAVKGIFQDPEAFTSQAPFLFLLALLIVLIFGPGLISMDEWIRRRILNKGGKP